MCTRGIIAMQNCGASHRLHFQTLPSSASCFSILKQPKDQQKWRRLSTSRVSTSLETHARAAVRGNAMERAALRRWTAGRAAIPAVVRQAVAGGLVQEVDGAGGGREDGGAHGARRPMSPPPSPFARRRRPSSGSPRRVLSGVLLGRLLSISSVCSCEPPTPPGVAEDAELPTRPSPVSRLSNESKDVTHPDPRQPVPLHPPFRTYADFQREAQGKPRPSPRTSQRPKDYALSLGPS